MSKKCGKNIVKVDEAKARCINKIIEKNVLNAFGKLQNLSLKNFARKFGTALNQPFRERAKVEKKCCKIKIKKANLT